MKPTEPSFQESLEAEAKEQLAALRAYRTYRGSDPDYRQRAKIALGVIGSSVRLRATLANERSNELIEARLLGSEPSRSLPAGGGR